MSQKKNKMKENPLIKTKKAKNVKESLNNDEGNEIKKFIIILVVLVVIIGALYGLSLFLNKEEVDYSYELTEGEVSYDIVSVGTLLNRPYNDYYVLLYSTESLQVNKYATLLSMYMDKSEEDNYIKIYFCDLNNYLNKPYYNVGDDNVSNPQAKNIDEFDFGEITLLRIRNNRVTEYIEDYDQIEAKLGVSK